MGIPLLVIYIFQPKYWSLIEKVVTKEIGTVRERVIPIWLPLVSLYSGTSLQCFHVLYG